jgi:hypothetical protein
MTVKAEPWNLDVFTTIVDFQSSYFLDRFKLGEIFIAFEREQHLRRTFEHLNRQLKQTFQKDSSNKNFGFIWFSLTTIISTFVEYVYFDFCCQK